MDLVNGLRPASKAGCTYAGSALHAWGTKILPFLKKSHLLAGFVKQAERVGFEPTEAGEGYNGFRDRPNRPLWHLSHQLPADYHKLCPNPPGVCQVQDRFRRSIV